MNENEIAINNRIEEIRKTTGLIPSDFARHIGVKPNTYLVTVTYSRRKPPIELMQAVLKHYKVNARWLLLGEGGMWDTYLIKENSDPSQLINTAKSIITQLSNLDK